MNIELDAKLSVTGLNLKQVFRIFVVDESGSFSGEPFKCATKGIFNSFLHLKKIQ